MRNSAIQTLLFAGMALAVPVAHATVAAPEVCSFAGTIAYQEGGWFTFETDINKEGGYLQFAQIGDFLLSPRYSAPIRKIVLSLRCTSVTPTRKLLLRPFVNGTEDASLTRTNETVGVKDEYETVSFDFNSSDKVDAFRLSLEGSGSTGNWGVNAIYVFYGEKTPDEDELLREFAKQLPTPENLHVENLTSNSFALYADPVEGASGYLFKVIHLTGTPRTERIERFANAPAFDPASGWTVAPENEASFDLYANNTSYTDGDAKSLKILNAKKTAVLLSPVCEERIVGYSLMYKAGTKEKTNTLTIYGRADQNSVWEQIGDVIMAAADSSKHMVSESIGEGLDYTQLKFVFEPGDDPTTMAVDSLCVFYGDDEAQEPVALSGDGKTENPEITVKDLETGRYAYRIMAEGEPSTYRNSSWSEEQVVDLAWAGISVSAPTDVVCVPSGSELLVSWTAVANADHYLVTVAPADDLWNPVVLEAKTTASTLSVPVPALGQYVVKVTAVSPGGVSRAKTTVEDCEMTLGKPDGLTVEAVAVDTVKAKWNGVPLAEGYQAKLFRITGDAGTTQYGWTAENGQVCLPNGWECDSAWTNDTWTSGSGSSVKYFPSLPYAGAWIASDAYPASVTKVVCKAKYGPSKQATVENTRFAVYVATSDGDWQLEESCEVATALTTYTLEFPAERNIRKVKFACERESVRENASVSLGEVTVSYGTYVRTEIASTGTKECEAVFRGLDPSGRYVVEVVPQPSGDDASATVSPVIDLAAEHFRKTGAISMAGLAHHLYAEDFSSLAEDARDADLGKIHLDHWQFFKGTGEAEKLLYAKTSKTTGGVYAFGDPDVTDSFCIGSLATKSFGCSLGLAFANDTDASVGAPTLTFDSVQRTFKSNPATYVLEWLVTDGATSIGTEGEWHAMAIPDTAPYTDETKGERTEHRETGISVTPELGGRIQPGQVLVFRWRHANLSSGPMMAIDNVRVEFPSEKGFNVLIR